MTHSRNKSHRLILKEIMLSNVTGIELYLYLHYISKDKGDDMFIILILQM